jgi:hypothetical protein
VNVMALLPEASRVGSSLEFRTTRELPQAEEEAKSHSLFPWALKPVF